MAATLLERTGRMMQEPLRVADRDRAEHAAHARMLEERPTAGTGEPFPLRDALGALESGQFVNCGAARAASPHDPADFLRTLAAALPTSISARALLPAERWAAEVLLVREETAQVVVGLAAEPEGIAVGAAITVDFTDVTGTYLIRGAVEEIAPGAETRLTVHCQGATRLQLRRFVRVPVLIAPHVLEVQAAPGEWHEVGGQIVDVSLGGAGLLVSEPLFGEAHVRVVFELPGRFGSLEVRGRIVEPPGPVEAGAGRRGGAVLAHRRGVAFEPLSVADLRRLYRALYHRQVELRRLSDSLPDRRVPVDATPAPRRERQHGGWRFWRR